MRNKIIFVLLFIFSFIIVHDTVLDMMQSDQHVIVSQDTVSAESDENCQTLQYLHNMFHFVALVESDDPVACSIKKESSVITVLLQYISLPQEQDDRPPIA